jgi:hypothetical protein
MAANRTSRNPTERGSSATDRDDNLNVIAVGKFDGSQSAARYDLAIVFHRDSFAFEPEIPDQVRDLGCSTQLSGIAIDAKRNHFFTCSDV